MEPISLMPFKGDYFQYTLKCQQRILDLPGHHFPSYSLALSFPFYIWALFGQLPAVQILNSILTISRASSWSHWRNGREFVSSLFGSKLKTHPPIGKPWKLWHSEFNKIKQPLFGYSNVSRAEIEGLIPGPVLSVSGGLYKTPRIQGYSGIHCR